MSALVRGLRRRSSRRRRETTLILLTAFFTFGAVVAAIAAVSLAFPYGPFELLWDLDHGKHRVLIEGGAWTIALLAMMCAACSLAAIGVWKRASWAYGLAFGIVIADLAVSAVNGLVRHDPRALIGVPIGVLLVLWLRSRRVRREFARPVEFGRERTPF